MAITKKKNGIATFDRLSDMIEISASSEAVKITIFDPDGDIERWFDLPMESVGELIARLETARDAAALMASAVIEDDKSNDP